ncbi:MAG: hypothetical protein GY834_09070, partial [Bacteroidetes bacterium]|nr:hypothetical protein [Bacteroidota bacterium]
YDLNHSKPAIAAYANDKKYLFVGSNGGMLHCIDDFNGDEKWAFIPKEQFNRLDKVYASDDHYHFMDGSPTVVDIVDDGNNYSNLVIVGERRGGNHYYAIDISDISSPKYKYTFPDVDDPSFGQSWKQAEFVYYKPNAGTPTKSFLLSGGYDDRYDHVDDLVSTVDGLNTDADPNNNVPDVKGAQIHIINASDGTTIQKFDKGFTGLEHMEASILSAWGIDLVDDSEKAISQIYASDLEGHIFALRDIDLTKSGDVIDGNWEANHLFEVTGASRGKKTFRELDFVQEFMYYYSTTDKEWKHTIGDFTYFGTGDRADPLNNNGSDKTNYFYCVKNDWVTKDITTEKTIDDYGTLDSEPTGANNDLIMVDVTDAIIYDGEIPESVAHISSRSNRGWYIKLEGLGEKCLSTPIVYAGVVYFTTYTPPSGSGNDPCGTSLIGGIAQLYALDYKTGGPVYDFGGDRIIDPGEKLTKTDRAYTLKTQNITIPPDFVIIITEDGAKGFVGPEDFPVKEPNAGVTSFYWKTL